MKPLRWVFGIAALVVLGVLLWFATRPPPLTVQGEVSADRVDVSSRVSGRVIKLAVDVGDTVDKGAVIAQLENPELVAATATAQAALDVAKADLARVDSTRPENIDAKRADRAAAQADVILAQQTYDRQAELVKTGNTPQAKVDEAVRNLEAAQRKREAADAALRLVSTGASPEERALSAAQVKQAEATQQQRQVDVTELAIHAPISGQITTRVAELGENFSPGAPLYALIDLQDIWFTFNLREDLLGGLKVGDKFTVTVPAFRGEAIPVHVTMINVQGQYATWRATRATGDFDLRTFEVRAKPDKPMDGLRPGMSAIASWTVRAK